MEVNDVGLLTLDQFVELGMRCAVPDSAACQRESAEIVHLLVVDGVADDVVAVRFQQLGFVGEDLIFTAGLLVEIVSDDDLQKGLTPAFCGLMRLTLMLGRTGSSGGC